MGRGRKDATLGVGLAAHALHGAADAVAQAREQRADLLLRAAGLRTPTYAASASGLLTTLAGSLRDTLLKTAADVPADSRPCVAKLLAHATPGTRLTGCLQPSDSRTNIELCGQPTCRARKRISSDEGVSLTAKKCSSISSPSSDSAAARGVGGCMTCSCGACAPGAEAVMTAIQQDTEPAEAGATGQRV